MTIRSFITTETLRLIKVFQGMDEKGYQKLLEITRRRPYEAGHTVIREGDTPSEIFFIVRGWVKVLLPNDYVLLGAGEIFGETSLMENGKFLSPGWRHKKRNATCIAHTPLDIIYVHVDPLATILADYPEVMARFDKLAKERSRESRG
jgi:CRP-like cAMP-binding protein